MAEGPQQRAQRRVGTMVRDKYRIDAFLATGSMANVYAATHRNGSRVALKILHRELAQDAALAERFKREGYFANAIAHPGVVRAIDDDVDESGCPFIVLELLEGDTLEERRQHLGGKIPLPEALHIGDAMLDVLAAAHGHEVLHRDLKPENVFITRKNEVKLLDFGVARFNDGRASSDMTGIGMVLGTPAFMPPEQALGRREEVDARSDIWGVGATLFTVITGEAVHAGGDAKTKLIATARTPARPIRDVMPDVPRAVASVVDRALCFDKSLRWADANAMREALRWARMSVEGADEAVASPRRAGSEELTIAREMHELFEDSTAKRGPVVDIPVPPSAMPRSGDDVYTSAPPVTRREEPPSMAFSEGPTFSLRREAAPVPAPPITERIPGAPARPSAPATRVSPQMPIPPETAPAIDMAEAGEIFRAALANAAGSSGRSLEELADLATIPRMNARSLSADETANERPPSRAAGGGKMASTVPIGAPVARPPFPSAPPNATHPSGPPPTASGNATHPDAARAAGGTGPAPRMSSPPWPSAEARTSVPSRPPEDPGPLLATIVPRKPRRMVRALVSIAVGLLAGAVTYAVVVRLRSASASDPTPVAAHPSSEATPPPPPPSASAPVAASALPAAPPTGAVSAVAATTAKPKPKRVRKPRPAPVAAASSAAPTPTAEPDPPAPEPPPVPQDSLPRKEDNPQ